MSSEYVPPAYWTQVLQDGYDESAVGYPNLARSFNSARYDLELRNVALALAAAGVPTPARVLDVGSGTGIWIDFWRRRGVRDITGVDLTETAVEHLRERHPEHTFLRADVGDAAAGLPGPVDVVSAMSVLLHITDEARFERALGNLLAALGPDGVLLLVEPIVVHRWWGPPFGADANSKARPLATYERILAAGGFEVVDLRPVSCLLTNVIDTRRPGTFRLMSLYWEAICRIIGRRERLGSVAGSVLGAADRLATRIVPNGPSAKILVARRRPPA
jgi:SAM-dependent methyltransferase